MRLLAIITLLAYVFIVSSFRQNGMIQENITPAPFLSHNYIVEDEPKFPQPSLAAILIDFVDYPSSKAKMNVISEAVTTHKQTLTNHSKVIVECYNE